MHFSWSDVKQIHGHLYFVNAQIISNIYQK